MLVEVEALKVGGSFKLKLLQAAWLSIETDRPVKVVTTVPLCDWLSGPDSVCTYPRCWVALTISTYLIC